jgi:hypothetical protein
MKTKKLKKKWNKFCYKVIEEQERKEKKKEERRYGWGKIKNKSGKRK